jgi:wobble nucleotide-excising tRNase
MKMTKKKITPISKSSLKEVAEYLRQTLEPENKKLALIFAHNGTGKTRLSMEFKELGKADESRDTLYFNAFTEDLFHWNNDIEKDLDDEREPTLKINIKSKFFNGLEELEMENRIRPLLRRYADFDFRIDYKNGSVNFEREIRNEGDTPKTINHIKVSRGEENIFIWCFFLVVAQLAVDKQEAYKWVKYLYIDDPISSLDDNNTIAIACHLSQLLKSENNDLKTVISSHHALFFNVMWNENKKGRLAFYFRRNNDFTRYVLEDTEDTPAFHHVALLKQLHEVVESGKVYTYHFNVLRSILEKIASFHGFGSFSDCISKDDKNDPDEVIHNRILNLLSHGNYSLFEPQELLEENQKYFRQILEELKRNYRFNPELFKIQTPEVAQL